MTTTQAPTVATAMHDLAYLTASDSKVRLGYTTSNGRSDKTDPMTAADATLYLEAMVTTLESFGVGFLSLTVYRWEGGL